ncbi:MAG: hypothetical protein KA165_04310 [Saprospiraceae bacterium]|nr:hypothetical protein [Saprospiraceae bacterium]
MKKTILIAASLLLPMLLLAQPQRYYVDQAAAGQNNGQSWPDAFTDLHDALALAQAGDEIWVAGGIYHPGAVGERAARFEMLSGVKLYGGFAGTELDMSERDLAANATVLDGDIGAPGDSTDNSYNLLYLYRPDSLTVVDGFIFRNALANDPAAAAGAVGSSGAALYIMAVDGAAYPLIRHCVFEHNSARCHGGAVYVNGGGSGSAAPVFRQCRFASNRAVEGNGGALYRNGGSWVDKPEDIDGCVFEENRAYLQGGGVYFSDSPRSDTFDIAHTEWKNNRVDPHLPGVVIYQGAAIHVNNMRTNGATILSVRDLKASRHTTGDFIIAGDGVSFSEQNFAMVIDSMLLDSAYGIRGEVFGWAQCIVRNISFVNSIADINILSDSDQLAPYSSFENILIKKPLSSVRIQVSSQIVFVNKFICADAPDYLEISNDHGHKLTTANLITRAEKTVLSVYHLASTDRWIRLINSAILQDFSNVGFAGILNPEIKNCVLIDEHPPYMFSPGFPYTPVFDHNLFNFPDTFDTSNWIKTGNLWGIDPLFMNPDSGDFRLHPCSPAIDAGNNAAAVTATDIAGGGRIQGGTVDIGAYESAAFGLAAEPAVKGACNGEPDGAIDVSLAGACEPLDVSWQSGAQSGTTLSGLAPGAYQVTVTDAKGHSLAFSAAVPAADPPILQADGSPVSCFGADDALLSVKPLSGQPPFAYLWSPTGTTDSVVAGLSPGPVSVTVTDAWGCTATFSFDIPEPDTLQFTATVQDATGQQIADGSIAVNGVAGGTPPYGYLWSPGGSTDDMLTGLTPGFYTLTVTDERGCQAVWTFEVKYTSDTKEGEGQAVLLIYPNPAGESTVLSADFRDKPAPALLEIYDAGGRLARSAELPAGSVSGWSISLEGLSAGYYTVLLRDAAGKAIGTGKLIKK